LCEKAFRAPLTFFGCAAAATGTALPDGEATQQSRCNARRNAS